jgi:hypothetical protein
VSRGAGKWQRAILAAVADTEYDINQIGVIVYNVLGREPTRPELVAARRAVKTLALAGKIRAVYRGTELCAVRPDSEYAYSLRCRTDIPDWVTWVNGKTREENRRAAAR